MVIYSPIQITSTNKVAYYTWYILYIYIHIYPQPQIYTFTELHSSQILSPSIRTNILDEVTQNP